MKRLLACLVVFGALACDSSGGGTDLGAERYQCVPNCAGRTCGTDDCGGTCGTCADTLVCDPVKRVCGTAAIPDVVQGDEGGEVISPVGVGACCDFADCQMGLTCKTYSEFQTATCIAPLEVGKCYADTDCTAATISIPSARFERGSSPVLIEWAKSSSSSRSGSCGSVRRPESNGAGR